MMRLTPKSLLLLVSLATALCVVLLVTCIPRPVPPPYEFKTLDYGNGRTIVIRLGKSLDQWGCYPVYYEARDGDHTVIPERHVTGVWPGTAFGFELISAESGCLAGVVLRPLVHNLERLPDFGAGDSWTREVVSESLIIVHDFNTNQSFASVRAGENPAARTLVTRLLAAHSEWNDDSANAETLRAVVCLNLDDDEKSGVGSALSRAHLLPALEAIVCHSPISAKGVECLSHVATLKALVLSGAAMGDDDVLRLRALHHLKTIILPLTGPSPKAVNSLRDDLQGTQVIQRDRD
jgi:hypothetical protein